MNKKRILSLLVTLSILVGLIALPADAGNRIGSRRALLRVGEEIRYLLRATFSVGNVALNAGDVNTQAPGSVEDGTLTAVETDGSLSITSNKLAFTAQGTPLDGDQGMYSPGAATKALGLGLLSSVNVDATNTFFYPVGWTEVADSVDFATFAVNVYSILLRNNGQLQVRPLVAVDAPHLFAYSAAIRGRQLPATSA